MNLFGYWTLNKHYYYYFRPVTQSHISVLLPHPIFPSCYPIPYVCPVTPSHMYVLLPHPIFTFCHPIPYLCPVTKSHISVLAHPIYTRNNSSTDSCQKHAEKTSPSRFHLINVPFSCLLYQASLFLYDF